jgi:hypothetical protein
MTKLIDDSKVSDNKHIKDLIQIRKEVLPYNYNISGNLTAYSLYSLDKQSAQNVPEEIEYAEDMVKDKIIKNLLDTIYYSRSTVTKRIGGYIILSPKEYSDLLTEIQCSRQHFIK